MYSNVLKVECGGTSLSYVCTLAGGDRPYMLQFHMNKTTGDLWLGPKLDREEVPYVSLIIKATEDCLSDHWEREENRRMEWNETDPTLLWVSVKVIDINDNQPTFSKHWFTAGVTRDTQYGADVIDLTVSDDGVIKWAVHQSEILWPVHS